MSMPTDAAFIPSEGSNEGPREVEETDATAEAGERSAHVGEDNVPTPGSVDVPKTVNGDNA